MSIREAKVYALDRLLLERFGGKVGRGLALEYSRHRAHSNHVESLFVPVLTICNPPKNQNTRRTFAKAIAFFFLGR